MGDCVEQSDCQEGPCIDLMMGSFADGVTYFEGLMEVEQISSNLVILEEDYDGWYRSRGELDERMFINGEDSLIGAVSSSSTTSVCGVKVMVVQLKAMLFE